MAHQRLQSLLAAFFAADDTGLQTKLNELSRDEVIIVVRRLIEQIDRLVTLLADYHQISKVAALRSLDLA